MILDIGCGFAKERDVSSFPRRYKANPRGDVNIDIGKLEVKIKNYVRCDASHLCFKDKTFKKVVASHVLEHLKNPVSCLREIKRVLNVDGVLEVRVPNRYSELRGYDSAHVWHWDKNSFKRVIQQIFPNVEVTVDKGCWVPIRGNRRVWGKYLIKIFPFLANELRAKAWT
ncbi:MAG: class I SAM-dependent methyltransferase [Deltaproteobacteria bacterium]|nr:class I SAM-dependent methyltransferase [Deltaproteobacteria bacterium]